MDRIDTHLHLIDLARFSDDWTAGFPPLAGKRFRIGEYLAVAEGSGITQSIIMDVDLPEKQSISEAAFSTPSPPGFLTQHFSAKSPAVRISPGLITATPAEFAVSSRSPDFANTKSHVPIL